MGRGSDTRMYAPRSESSHMYSSANEDEDKYNPTSPEDNEKRAEAKKLKEEEAKKKAKEIKHIKIKPSQGLGQGAGLETEPGLDDGNKRDDEREIGLQGGPAGSRGHLLDLATGAKTGTGSAMGTGNSAVRTGEPMADAWSSLLKGHEPWELDYHKILSQGGDWDDYEEEAEENRRWSSLSAEEQKQEEMNDIREETNFCAGCFARTPKYSNKTLDGIEDGSIHYDEAPEQFQYHDLLDGVEDMPDKYHTDLCNHCSNVLNENQHHFWDSKGDFIQPSPEIMNQLHNEFNQSPIAGMTVNRDGTTFDHNDIRESGEQIQTGDPMADAWSDLLKRDTMGTIEARRRREKRREFRPSTGQFKKPPGGQSGGVGATMKRFKARMRGIKGGKKTGLMKPHLSVEMSHRGIATKQPMSKDPQKYRQYMGQQEAQKILGGVRNTYSPHARHSARSFTAGPTGGGRLTGMLPGQSGQMRQPALRRMRRPRMPRMPRMPRVPAMPQMPQMAPPMSSVPSMPAPSSTMMMSEERTESDLLKGNRHANRVEMLQLMRQLIELQRKKANMKKAGTASAFEEGAVPAHPAGVHQHEDEDEKNDGPTQNLEMNSSRLGVDTAGYLQSKRGHMG